MAGLVVCFAGQIGSGKSSVSRRLGEALAWPRAAFGDYLRAELGRHGGDPESREQLQNLGQKLVDEEPSLFCSSVMSSSGFKPGGDLLLDGVRHVEIQRIAAELARPSQTKLIYLAAAEDERRERVAGRVDRASDFVRASTHRVETELGTSLPKIADILIDSTAALDEVVNECLSALALFGLSPEIISRARGRLRTLKGPAMLRAVRSVPRQKRGFGPSKRCSRRSRH
jgi:cytidylate kinase